VVGASQNNGLELVVLKHCDVQDLVGSSYKVLQPI
jgi:hypothetical protein